MRLIIALLAVAGLAASAVADKTRADKLFDDGRRYLSNHEYALACTAFEQSQQADPALGTQLNIALCYEQWGPEHVVAAYRAYQDALKTAKQKRDNREKAAARKIAELEAKVPHLTVKVPDSTDASAVFLFDGKETDRAALAQDTLVEPGDHTIEVRVPGAPAKVQKVHLAVGAHENVTIDVPKVVVVAAGTPVSRAAAPPTTTTERKKGRLYGGIALTATGGIALGVASYVALIARSDYNDAIATCPSSTCTTRGSYNSTQTAISHANDATIVGGVGLVVAAVGVYLIATSKGEVAAAPMVAPNTVGLAIGGQL